MIQALSDRERRARRGRLLRGYASRAEGRRRALEVQLGADAAQRLAEEARAGFEALLDEIPYAGREDDPLARSLLWCYEILPYALALRRRGCASEQIGAFIDTALELPPPRPRAAGLGRRLRARLRRWRAGVDLRRRARASQRRAHPAEFVYRVVEDDGSGFELGYDVTQCAICTAYAKHDALELVPYLCALDDKLSRASGYGLRRTGTRALGASRCDFRFQRGGEPLPLANQYDLATGRRL